MSFSRLFKKLAVSIARLLVPAAPPGVPSKTSLHNGLEYAPTTFGQLRQGAGCDLSLTSTSPASFNVQS